MKKSFFISLLFAITCTSHSQTVSDLINKGESFNSNEQYDSALILLNKAWKIDSTDYYLIVALGNTYMGLKKWEESFSFYTRGITQFPDSAYAYHHRAILLATLRYNDEAIADNTKALELVEKDSLRLMLFINRGTNYSQKRAFQKAYEDYYRAYLIDTSNTAVLNNMATVLDELGRREEAIVQLKKIIRIDSTFVGSYVNLGFQYTKLGKYKEAIEFFDKALSIEKDEPLTLNNRGLAKYYLTDYKGALNDINKSISIYPANSYAFKNRALVYIALKQTDKACIDIQAALDKGFTEMYGNEVIDLQKANCPAK